MNFLAIKGFLAVRMRMSHVYQPVMIRHLLLSGGQASIASLAGEILSLDKTQIEYYEIIVKTMV